MAELDLDDITNKAVDEATSEDTFDALDFFTGSILPEGTVTAYRDTAAAVRLAEIKRAKEAEKNREEDEGLSLTDDVEYIDEDEIDELSTRLKQSAVTFKLRAVAPAARTAMEKAARAKYKYVEGAENPDYFEALNANLIAKSIVSVSNYKGQTDPNTWDAARVMKFIEVTETSEWNKVFAKVYELNYVGDAIDQAVNADF